MKRIMNLTESLEMFKDIWELYKDYAGRKLSQAECNDVVGRTSALCKKYKSSFCDALLIATVEELELTEKHFKCRKESAK